MKDINPGSSSSSPSNFASVGATLYFQATGVGGSELWKTDGTAMGTMLVKDINPGSGGSNPSNLTNVNGTLFSTADNGATGSELWTSDGTAGGTGLVKDINLNTQGTEFNSLGNKEGTLYFVTSVGSNFDQQLWKSDGTASGTRMVKDLGPYLRRQDVNALSIVNGIFYYVVSLQNGHYQFWRTDGTTAGTLFLTDIYTGYTGYSDPSVGGVEFNGKLYFFAGISDGSVQLWETDGTAVGTVLVTSLSSPGVNTGAGDLTVVGSKLFFEVSSYPPANPTNVTQQLWCSDGTAAGTVFIRDFPATSSDTFWVGDLTNLDGSLFFTVFLQDTGLAGTVAEQFWTSDGTTAGTSISAEVDTTGVGQIGDAVSNLTNVGNRLFFSLTTVTYGSELWAYDEVSGKAYLVKDINPGFQNSSPQNLTDVNGILYFSATIGTQDVGLWRSDGTEAGTTRIDKAFGPQYYTPTFCSSRMSKERSIFERATRVTASGGAMARSLELLKCRMV